MSSGTTTFSVTSPADLPTEIDGSTVIFDTEGTGVHKLRDRATLGLLKIDGHNYAVPWTPSFSAWLGDQLPKAGRVVAHYAKHDYHMCANEGVPLDALYAASWTCTVVESVLCDDNRFSYSLDDLGATLFGETKSHNLYQVLADHFGGLATAKAQAPNIGRINTHEDSALRRALIEYGFQDLDLTSRLHEYWKPQIKDEGLGRVLDLERRALRALVEMERRGAPIFMGRVDEVRQGLERRAAEIQDRIIRMTGREINPRSPKDMVYAFTVLGIPIRYTTTKRPSFNKEILAGIDHDFIRALTSARSIKTLLDTFINSSIGNHVGPDGRIHTNFNQVKTEDNGARTGRLSSSDPNLQQIPARDGELAPMVRGLFGLEGKTWLCGDWEQFEFRVFGHYANDPTLTKIYQEKPDTDFHQAVADLTSKPRDKAKRINLGLVFGMGEGKLAKELGLPYTTVTKNGREYLEAGPEAKELFADYHRRFPGAKMVLTRAANLARRRGYIKTLYGRRIRFAHGGEHTAGGLVFQGTSADLMKRKLVECNDRFRKTDVEFILVVHDEFDFLIPPEMAQETRAEVKRILEGVDELRIPVLSDVKVGNSWWDASA